MKITVETNGGLTTVTVNDGAEEISLTITGELKSAKTVPAAGAKAGPK